MSSEELKGERMGRNSCATFLGIGLCRPYLYRPCLDYLKNITMKELKKRIAELENELRLEKSKNESSSVHREKIKEMSSEVVDSNPYRSL